MRLKVRQGADGIIIKELSGKTRQAHSTRGLALGLCCLLLLATGDMIARAGAGSITGSAAAVVLLVAILTMSVLHAAVVRRPGAKVVGAGGRATIPLVSIAVFLVWSTFTLATQGAVNGQESAQNYLAVVLTAGSILYFAWVATIRLTQFILAGSLYAAWALFLVYGVQLATSGLGAQGVLSRRSFAIVATLVLCAVLAQWSHLRWPSKVVAVLLVIEIALSGSRMALALVVIAFAVAAIGRSGRVFRVGVVALLGATSFVVLANTWPPLRDRFFSGDVSLTIGGVTINAEGRTEIWQFLLSQPTVDGGAGHGIGSAQARVTEITGGAMNQPHNEFIRLLFDYGPIGLVIAGIFAVSLIATLFSRSRRLAPDNEIHVAALGATLVLAGFMLTDNPMVYPWAFIPFSVFVGVALGRSHDAGGLQLRSSSQYSLLKNSAS